MKGIATGIGSLPFRSYLQAIQIILQYCPKAPYWPQLPHDFEKGGMICQFISKGPISLEQVDGRWRYSMTCEPWHPPTLTGLEILGWAVMARHEWIKGQITGPLTLGLVLEKREGGPLLDDPEAFSYLENALLEAVRVQLKGLLPASKKVLIFLDEPILGLEQGKRRLEGLSTWYEEFVRKVRGYGAIPGLHCCGDFSWDQILDLGPSLVSFDAHSYSEEFLKARDRISRFVEQGGTVAFGVVPTLPGARRSVDEMEGKLNALLKSLVPSPDLFFITPSCGLGMLREEEATEILKVTALLAERFS